MLHLLWQNKPLILASKSPRRVHIFEMAGLKFEQIPANIDEPDFTDDPQIHASTYAQKKAQAIACQFPDSYVVGSDTLVAIHGRILGKPENREHAVAMLKTLSGNWHEVYSGVAVVQQNQQILAQAVARTEVLFYDLKMSEIEHYIDTQEPFDKAGSYGIQGYGAQFVREIQGCYFNVMGFPLPLFYQLSQKIFQKG